MTMKNYELGRVEVHVPKERSSQPDSPFNSSAGELGWITRQLRSDLAFENGCVQRCKKSATVKGLIRLKHAVEAARRGASVKMRYWTDVDLENGVVVHLADSGHANGMPEGNDIFRYRSVGGHYILIANPGILQGEAVRANIVCYHSSQTKRVCRSTLAAEASHLSESVEAGDWVTVLLHKAFLSNLDLAYRH